MRIILDGCDKAGKSTLVDALKNEIPSLIALKLMSLPKDGSEGSKQYIKQMHMHMAEMTRDQKAHYLFDRWFPSEMVYSFKRKYEAMDDPFYWGLEKEIRKTPHLYVLLDVDRELLVKRFKAENEKFAKVDEINRIKTRYLKHFNKSTLNKIKVDPTDNLEEVIAQIKDAMADILNVKTVDYTNGVPTELPGQSLAHKAAVDRGNKAREAQNG